jgi:hypothetical protein
MAAENWERDGRSGGGTPLPRVPWRRSGMMGWGCFFWWVFRSVDRYFLLIDGIKRN